MAKPITEQQKQATARMIFMAKWAKFFDALGIEWHLETAPPPNKAIAQNDFWLPSFDGGTFVIARQEPLTEIEMKAAMRLCERHALNVWLAIGLPDYRAYELLIWREEEKQADMINGIPNADQAEDSNRMFVLPGYEQQDGRILRSDFDMLGDTFVKAVEATKII